MINADAEHVKNYAATHVGADRKDPPDAGDDAAPAPGNEPNGPAEPWMHLQKFTTELPHFALQPQEAACW